MVIKVTSYFHAGHLYEIASKAARSKAKKSDNTIVAIMFCASALEAFINEPSGVARTIPSADKQRLVEGYASVMGELEDRKESLIAKYQMALLIFSGEVWNKGDTTFQDLRLLITIRNDIVHMKTDEWKTAVGSNKPDPERGIEQYPKYIKTLQEKRLIDPPSKSQSWLEAICDQRVSLWACRTAAKITTDFAAAAPSGRFKESLQNQAFQMP
jgi:hypothetical protein